MSDADARQVQSITVEATLLRAGRCDEHAHLDEPVPCAACAATIRETENLGVVARLDAEEA